MLTRILLHPGQPVAPHDIWSAWNLDPILLGGIAAVAWLYGRGRRRPDWGWFGVAVLALGLALVSPLEAMSGALASAHMSQHLLLILVAAPAFVHSEAAAGVLGGLPLTVRKGLGLARRTLGLAPARIRRFFHPVLVWLLHAGVLLFWHAAGPYQLALRLEPVHYLEHASFLITALWFWQLVLSTRHRSIDWPGASVLMVFGLAGQSVFLALLMTFAESPWYSAYANTTSAWGITPLTDQHLAGVIMWVPAGFGYTGVGLTLLSRWLTAIETQTSASERALLPARGSDRNLGD